MSKSNVRGRLDWVDCLKGLGIIAVVYVHEAKGVYSSVVARVEDGPIRYYSVAWVCSWVLPMFFFCSGIFAASGPRDKPLRVYWLEKLKQLGYPYLIWSVLQTTAEVFTRSGMYSNRLGLESVVRAMYFPRAQFWFVYVLLIMLLFSSVVQRILPRRAPHVLVAAALAAYFSPIDGYVELRCARQYLFFVTGLLLAARIKEGAFVDRLRSWVWVLGPVSGASFAIVMSRSAGSAFNTPFTPLGAGALVAHLLLACVSIAFVGGVAVRFASTPPVARALGHAGQHSLSIYLAHIVCAGSAHVLLHALGEPPLVVGMGVGLLAGVLLPLALTRWSWTQVLFKWPFAKPSTVGSASSSKDPADANDSTHVQRV
jgi:fucose 4-O-acetylase-like acetyltransferase